MNGTTIENVNALLNQGVEEATHGSKTRAQAIFNQVVEADRYNELALMWLAYLSNDPYKSVELLEKVVNRNAKNELARNYLSQARAKCTELEQLVTTSSTYSTWNRVNQGNPVAPVAVPRLGEFLLRQGLITPQQLEMALRRHEDLVKRGHRKMLGQVFLELGYITQSQLDNWLQQQNGEYSDRFKD